MTMTEERPDGLTPFEGTDVAAVGIEIRNAAGGLNDAMSVAPAEWHLGDTVTVVMRGTVVKLRHEQLKETPALRRVHVLTADTCVVLANKVVDKALDQQAKKVAEMRSAADEERRAAKGELAMEPGMGLGIEEELQAAHGEGDHADGLMAGCPSCEAEREAVEAGD